MFRMLKLLRFDIDNNFENISFSGVMFNSPEITPSIQEIEQSFGATHPGIYDSERRLFMLNFRGLCFCFNVDSKFQVKLLLSVNSFAFLSVLLLLFTFACCDL